MGNVSPMFHALCMKLKTVSLENYEISSRYGQGMVSQSGP